MAGEGRAVSSADVQTPCLTGVFRATLILPADHCRESRGPTCRRSSPTSWLMPEVTTFSGTKCCTCNRSSSGFIPSSGGPGRPTRRPAIPCVIRWRPRWSAMWPLTAGTLARLALAASGPALASGLAMAHTSDVRRRIASLERTVFRSSLSWKSLAPAMLFSNRGRDPARGASRSRTLNNLRSATRPAPRARPRRMITGSSSELFRAKRANRSREWPSSTGGVLATTRVGRQ